MALLTLTRRLDLRKLIATLALVGACSSKPTPAPAPAPASAPAAVVASNETGATSPAAAVRGYLTAAQTQDLQAMARVWGTKDGSALTTLPREELEKRELINIRCLSHDNFDIISDAPATGGKRAFAVMLRRKDQTRTTNFYTV